MSAKIKILNPAGGPCLTSAKQAARYVKRGLAHWTGDAIEFSRPSNDHREAACSVSLERRRHNYGVGIATLGQIAGLPVVSPIKLLTGKRSIVQPVDYPDAQLISSKPLPFQAVRPLVAMWKGNPLESATEYQAALAMESTRLVRSCQRTRSKGRAA